MKYCVNCANAKPVYGEYYCTRTAGSISPVTGKACTKNRICEIERDPIFLGWNKCGPDAYYFVDKGEE